MADKILVVTRSTPLHQDAGGMERMSWDLAVELARHCTVQVLTTPVAGYPSHFMHDGLSVKTVACPSGRYSLRWWMATYQFGKRLRDTDILSVSSGAASLLRSAITPGANNHAIFQAHGTAYRELVAVLSGGRLRALRRVPRLARWLLFDVATYRLADCVVAVGPQVFDVLRRRPYRLPWKHTDLDLIPNGVSAPPITDLRRKAATERGGRYVVAGRLDTQKGADRAISLFTTDTLVESTLIVAGDGPERTRLEQEVRDLALSDRVHLLGRLESGELASLLAGAELLLLPSRAPSREGLPMVALEAINQGCPVAASPGIKWPEALRPFIVEVDFDDRESAARAIRQADHIDTRLPSEFRIEHVAARYLSLFESQRAPLERDDAC